MGKQVLILTPFFGNPGGAESFVCGLIAEAKKNFCLTMLTFQPFQRREPSYQETFENQGWLKIYRLSWLGRSPKVWRGLGLRNLLCIFPTMLLAAISLCVKNKYDVIHAQGLIAGLVAGILKRFFKTKVFITMLALYDFDKRGKLFNAVCKWIFNQCDIIFVEGNGGYKDISKVVGCDDNSRIRKFNHWVGKEFKPPETRPETKIKVLFIGRPIPEKGRDVVEEAEEILNELEFTYVENAEHSELPKIYQDHHILVVPSKYSEGHTRVVCEGASCGCAVLTSDKGSLPEQVAGWGLSVPIEKFTQALKILSLYPYGWMDRAYAHAQKHFSPKNAEIFIKEYANA